MGVVVGLLAFLICLVGGRDFAQKIFEVWKFGSTFNINLFFFLQKCENAPKEPYNTIVSTLDHIYLFSNIFHIFFGGAKILHEKYG
jgi:hypothetical protein